MKKGCLVSLGVVGGLMVLGIGGCIYIAEQYEKEHPELALGSKTLLAVEQEIMSYKGSDGLGSNERAREIANQYSVAMRAARQVFFTGKDDSKTSLSQGHFITYCSLLPERCAFIVHVPQLRNYVPEARKEMADMAWRMAIQTLRANKVEVKELAVGIHGVMNFGEILVGTPTVPGEAETGIKQRTTDNTVLFPFLAGAAAPGTASQKN